MNIAERYNKAHNENLAIKKENRKLTKQHQEDNDIIASLNQEILELDKMYKDLLLRYEKECYNIVVNGDYVTQLIALPSYREYMPMQTIDGYDMSYITRMMETALYQKIPFVYVDGRQLKVDEAKHNKFKGALI